MAQVHLPSRSDLPVDDLKLSVYHLSMSLVVPLFDQRHLVSDAKMACPRRGLMGRRERVRKEECIEGKEQPETT